MGAYNSASANRLMHAAIIRNRRCLRRLMRTELTRSIIPQIDGLIAMVFRGDARSLVAVPCIVRSALTCPAPASQTQFMAHTYLLFDFGSDEEKAQQARHKLEGWKQAFRLDKKLLYKVDRGEDKSETAEKPGDATEAEDASAEKSAKTGVKGSKSAKPSTKGKSKGKEKSAEKESVATAANGKVSLMVRLYFSGHEKLTEQRWLERIPSEEPFKDASPRVVRQGEPQFDELVQQFDSLE
jgi:hypothetical protein